MATDMDKDFDTQDLEAQADSILAQAGEVEEIPVEIEKAPVKSKKNAESEKKIPPLEESVIASLPAAAILNEQEKLRTAGRPMLSDSNVTEEKGVVLSFQTDVWPEVTLGQYKGLSAPKRSVTVTDDDVEERIRRLSDRNTRLVSVDREAKLGDTVVIDFEGFLNGEPFDGGKGENHSLELGSESFVPGFEAQLVGVKPGSNYACHIEKETLVSGLTRYTAVFASQGFVISFR